MIRLNCLPFEFDEQILLIRLLKKFNKIESLFVMWQYIYLLIIFAAAVICVGLTVYAWLQRSHQGALLYAGVMLAVAEWLFTSGMVSMSQTPAQARFWVDPRYFGLTAMLAFFIVFVIQYTGHEKWLTRPLLIVIFSIPILTQIIIETNSLHHLFLVEVNFSPDGILMGLDDVKYGMFFWFHTVYSYALVLLGIGLILQWSFRTFRLYRAQAVIMVFGILPPLITSVLDAFLLIPGLKHPLAPLGFAVMGMAFAWSMFRHRMLDIVPVARDYVIESMGDAMLVLDSQRNVVDVNPAARRLLGTRSSRIIGSPVDEVLEPWSELVEKYREREFAQFDEVGLLYDGQEVYFDLRIFPLKNSRGRSSGSIITLRDITSRKQAEKQLQKTLSKVQALQEKLYEQVIRDPLTDLYNRRFFNEIIPREFSRAMRESYPISFVMIDLDHFKLVNDAHGHKAGDLVLKQLAEILSSQTRVSDYVFRHGGEEFLVVLPGLNPSFAVQLAERWRVSLEESRVIVDDQEISVTMSVGVAAFSQDGIGFEEVLCAADKAMYLAKARGRNCTVLFSEPA